MISNSTNGLSEEEVIKSREKYGNNALKEIKTNSLFHLFLESLGDPIIKILLIALGIKIVFLIQDFDWYETVGIVIAIFVASFISSISEYGSEKAFKKLQEEASRINCKVMRDGTVKVVAIEEVVKGDIVVLESGDKIPADGEIIEGNISVDESSLNGEAKEKEKFPKSGNSKLDYQVFRGTTVYSKRALMRVLAVGDETVYGKLNLELGEESPESPLKLRLRGLALTISKIGYIGAILVSFSYLFSMIFIKNQFDHDLVLATLTNFPLMSGYVLYALTLSVTIIVVAVPEGLPMMITLVLSSNMKRMLKNHVLVRKMVGIETAGSINILFTDKTGTLTKGKLEVVEVLDGSLKKYHQKEEIARYPEYCDILRKGIVYNSDCSFDQGKVVGGNITDRALFSFLPGEVDSSIRRIQRESFDSKKKYSMTVIENSQGIRQMLIKGAMEKILPFCNHYYNANGKRKLLLEKKKVEEYIQEVTEKGIRVIVLASKDVRDQDLTLVAVVSIKDELRREAITGLELVRDAGIQTVMITGDSKDTALSIGRELGLVKGANDVVITSQELSNMSDDEVVSILPRLKIVARSLPSDKSRLIKIARKCNLVVGMTGDGVNDAPALKSADVGFAMGSGTEVAKEASDIVILDDNFLSISKAILYGRTIFKSIRKFIICQLTVNLCAIGLSFVGSFIGVDTPVTVIQMLWINMVMDTLTGLAFAFEPPLLEYMKERPKRKEEPIINRYMLGEIFFTGVYSFCLCLLFLKLPFFSKLYRGNEQYLMSAFFGLFIFIDIFNSFNARTHRLNLFAHLWQNKVFLAIVIFIALVQIGLIYYGGDLFRTIGLSFSELQVMILVASTVIPVDFFRKVYLRRKGMIGGV